MFKLRLAVMCPSDGMDIPMRIRAEFWDRPILVEVKMGTPVLFPKIDMPNRPHIRFRKLPRSRSVRQVCRRVLRRVLDHECAQVAGEVAFDFAFSIFPGALFTASLIGLLGITPEFVSESLDVLGILIPTVVRHLVDENIRHLVAASSQQLLTPGFLGAVWAASSAISATMKALNRAYGIDETRSFWKRRVLSVGLLFGIGSAMIVSFILLILGNWIEQHLLIRLGLERLLPTLVALFKWPIGFLSAVVVAALLYRIAPNIKPKLRQVIAGAALFAVLWSLLALGFGYYVSNFSYYNKVYGILGVFIIVQFWIYLTALILLVGGELNAELARGRDQVV